MNYTPNTREKLRLLLNNVEMFGLGQTLRHVLVYLLNRSADDFDQKHGVSTSGDVLDLHNEISDAEALDNAHNYEPTQERVMRHLLRHVEAELTPSELSFVDLGCGKGRALLMASELPFAQLIGVELSPALCAAAERNVALYGARRGGRPVSSRIRICCEDATRFEFPRTDLLVYMFNPFGGPVFRAVLERLVQFQLEHRRRVHVALSNPALDYVLETHRAFAKEHEFQVIRAGNSYNLWRCRATESAENAA